MLQKKPHEQGSVGVVVGGVVFVLLLAALSFFFLSGMGKSPNSSVATVVPTSAPLTGDIDKSGVADDSDKLLIRGQLGCKKEDPCWKKTVGKTVEGDNPLYAFDLDLDKDGVISQKDMDMVGK